MFGLLYVSFISPSYSANDQRLQIQPLAETSLLTDIVATPSSMITVGQHGHVLRYDYPSSQWRQVETPTKSLLTKVFFIDEMKGWAVGHDATILHTADGGLTWKMQMFAPELEKPFLDVLFFDAQHGVAVGAYGLFYRTIDGGQHWSEEFHQELLFEEDIAYLAELKTENEQLYLSEREALLPHFNRIERIDEQHLMVVGELGLIAISADQGHLFSAVDSPYEGSFFNILNTGNALYVMGLRGHLFKTVWPDMQWLQISTPSQTSINAALAQPDSITTVGNGGVIMNVTKADVATIESQQLGQDIVALAIDKLGDIWVVGSKGVQQLK